MARFTTKTFVTASIPAASSLNHNEVLGDSNINIYKVKVVPSIVGGTSEAQIYERDTFLVADLLWGTNPFTATGFDPIQKDSAGVITESLRGFIVPYEDKDASGELHIKLVNNDSQAKTYTITVEYEEVSIFSGDDLEIDGNLKFKSGTSFFGIFDHAITAERIWTLPDATATLLSSKTAVITDFVGPHAIGGSTQGHSRLSLIGDYTSDGSSTIGYKTFLGGALTGAPGDTTELVGLVFKGTIVTQTAANTIGNIASLTVNEPNITDNLTGGGVITQASTVRISGAPDEGVNNYALLVESGKVRCAGGSFEVSQSGPHSLGGLVTGRYALTLTGAFTSDGSTNESAAFRISTGLTGFAGDNVLLCGMRVSAAISTQTATETVNDIAQLQLDEPQITDNLTGGGVITNASTLLITGAPTEGVSNWAILVDSGAVKFGDILQVVGAIELDGDLNHDGVNVGFYGTTPAAQSAAYTRNATIVEDRTLLASASATATNNNNVLAALIADLQTIGLLG